MLSMRPRMQPNSLISRQNVEQKVWTWNPLTMHATALGVIQVLRSMEGGREGVYIYMDQRSEGVRSNVETFGMCVESGRNSKTPSFPIS